MSPRNSSRPLFTLRTDSLIGRSTEQRKLSTAIDVLQTTSDETILFYIAGDGGMGKTRLLEWVREQKLPAKTFCTTILDFYNSLLRTDIDLVEHIYDDISEQLMSAPAALTQGFERYVELRDRFRRQELGAMGGQTRTEVIKAFVDAWAPLAEDGYRLVVLLDTAELLRFQDDEVRQRFDAPQPAATSKAWVMGVVDNDEQLPGALFIVAGRKEESIDLYNELCAHVGPHQADPSQWVINLGGLDLAGVYEYFEELVKLLQRDGYREEAHQVRDVIDAGLCPVFHQLTGGSPITMAIALQLFIDGSNTELPDLLNEQLDGSVVPLEEAQQRMQRALVNALANYHTFGDMSIAVRYMALARKGLTADRLSNLLLGLSENLPEVNIEGLLDEVRTQIYVKQLPDGSLVLHDKVAEWAEEGLFAKGDQIKSYMALVEICQHEIDSLHKQIDHLIPLVHPAVSVEELYDEKEIAPEAVEEYPFLRAYAENLQTARRQRRNLVIDQMTYALRGDPVRGYKMYYELAEEAFNVGRMDYEAQIRSEFLGWWLEAQPSKSKNYKYRAQAQAAGLSEDLIYADFAIRAVQRTYSIIEAGSSPTARSQATIRLVERILQTVEATDNPFTIPQYARILLNVYADMARGQLATSDVEVEQARAAFKQHIKDVSDLFGKRQDIASENDLELFLLMGTQAFAYYELGFFERNSGNFGEAIKNYTRSLRPYRALGFEMNQARSLNDKAFALATIGNSQEADTAVNDALNLRKRLGFSYPIALSYNTRGIVHALSDRPVSALQNCANAMRIFESLSDEYGQMLANRAVAEAMRRDAERMSDNVLHYHQRLLTALRYSERATQLANKLLGDRDIFKIDVLIENGSVLRDLSRLYWQNPGLRPEGSPNADADAKAKSVQLLDRAIAIARTIPGARPQLVDAMIDLAYLRYYEIFAAEANKQDLLAASRQLLDDMLVEVPVAYRDPKQPQHTSVSRDLSVYWSLLCKGYGLWVTIEKESLILLGNDIGNEKSHMVDGKAFLQAAIFTLYFRSLLEANVRNVRRANQIVYESFQGFPVASLVEFQKQADGITESLGIPVQDHSMLCRYLEDNFGIEHEL